MPPIKQSQSAENSNKRTLILAGALAVAILGLLLMPRNKPQEAPVQEIATPAPDAANANGTAPAAAPATADANPAPASTPPANGENAGAAAPPAAPAAPTAPPSVVTEADLAGIPPEKLALYKDYCLSVANNKAREYRVDPAVFIQLNTNYINNCILMQAKPAVAPQE